MAQLFRGVTCLTIYRNGVTASTIPCGYSMALITLQQHVQPFIKNAFPKITSEKAAYIKHRLLEIPANQLLALGDRFFVGIAVRVIFGVAVIEISVGIVAVDVFAVRVFIVAVNIVAIAVAKLL